MSINDSLEKAKMYIQDAFAECTEYTQVASLFHSIVEEAKIQVKYMCHCISEDEQGGNDE